MTLSELMDKLGIPSQAKDIMAKFILESEIIVLHEDGRKQHLTGEVGISIAGQREIVLWLEA